MQLRARYFFTCTKLGVQKIDCNSIHHRLLTFRIYDICLHSGVEFLLWWSTAMVRALKQKKGVKNFAAAQYCNLMFCRFKLHVPEFLAAFSSSSSTASSSVCCVCKIPSSWIMHWSRSSPLQFVWTAREARAMLLYYLSSTEPQICPLNKGHAICGDTRYSILTLCL